MKYAGRRSRAGPRLHRQFHPRKPIVPILKNADGGLTLYIQKDSPGAEKEANWLPSPNDLVYLVMRLYWPKTEAPPILPPGEGTWKPPGIVKAK